MRNFNLRPFISLTIATLILSNCGGGKQIEQIDLPQTSDAPAVSAPSELGTITQAAQASQIKAEQLPDPHFAPAEDTQRRINLPKVKVAILLPLSGTHANLGQAMLQSAQMALFDVGHDNLTLIPLDTKGTADGAREAAQRAVSQQSQLILGPIFANSVSAAKPIAKQANLNMIAFSTNWSLADQKTFIMGFLPFDQIERIAKYSKSQGINRVGVIAPTTPYGLSTSRHYRRVAQQYGIETVALEQYDPYSRNLNPQVRAFTDFDKRTAAAEEIAMSKEKLTEGANVTPDDITRARANIAAPFDAVLMPVGGEAAITLANLMSQYDLPPRMARRLGTGLFDDPSLATEPSLRGSWFAAPSPNDRLGFENQYRAIYNEKPPRLASLSYDAMALAAVLARTGLEQAGIPAFNHASITNPNGFSGIDGIFRFHKNGLAERGLAVLEYQNGTIVEISPAPRTFQRK